MEKKQKTAILDKIGFIIILLNIVLLNIFIGASIKQPIWIIQAIISVFTVIYLIVNKLNKKANIIIKGKIDIAVIIFMISTIIPLLFKQQVTLDGTCNFILKYWSVFGMYVLVRNIITDEKKVKIIINTVIISSIIPIIIGYDILLKFNIFQPILDFIDSVKIEQSRMISIFGYANTFAAYLSLTISLAIAQFLNTEKKKIKILYSLYIISAIITILLTNSKAVLALLVFIILLFIVKGIKNKKISIKWIIVGIVIIILFAIYFFIAIQIDKPLEITEENKTCVIRGIESNTEYEFNFNIEAEVKDEYNTFDILIVEVNRYFSEKTIGRIGFSTFYGFKNVNVKTDDEIDHIEIRIKNPEKEKLTINELKINGSKYVLEYKIIPEELVRMFTTFNFKNPSVWQRTDYWRDGLDIIKDKWLLGGGGNTWRMLYGQKQDYLYYAKEAHSYVLEVWMSFGIMGLLSYLSIITISIKKGIEKIKNEKQEQQKNRNMLAIIVGIGVIILHSLMDFDMSYFIMQMMFFIFIAIINREDKNIYNNKKIIESLIICVFVIIAIGNTLGLLANLVKDFTGTLSQKIAPWVSMYKYNEIVYIENGNIENKTEKIKQYIKDEPYDYQDIMYEIMIEEIIKNPNTEDIQFLIDTWKTIPQERKYEVNFIHYRAEMMLKLAKELLEKYENDEQIKAQAKEILEIITKEYRNNYLIVLDYKRNKETESMAKYKYEYYTDVYDEATSLLFEEKK